MKLTAEQTQSVRDWLAAGASLADVQSKLRETFDLHLTYMDVRLLVLDIGAAVQDKPQPKEPVPPPAAPEDEEEPPVQDIPAEDEAPAPDGTAAPAAAANVSLSLDAIMVPGAMVSGTITFTDGVKAKWLVDQYGRFDLEPDKEGYQPSEADLRDLQVKLRAALQRKGMM